MLNWTHFFIFKKNKRLHILDDNEVSPFDDRWYINKDTGEITEKIASDIMYLPPIDISTITSRDVYDRLVAGRTSRRKYRLWVSPLLLDIVIERGMSIPALSILCYLGRNVGYNNMVYVTMKEIQEGSGYVRQTISTALTELKGRGFIREVSNKLEEKDSRFLLISPLYFFLGYYPNRDTLLRDWMLGK